VRIVPGRRQQPSSSQRDHLPWLACQSNVLQYKTPECPDSSCTLFLNHSHPLLPLCTYLHRHRHLQLLLIPVRSQSVSHLRLIILNQRHTLEQLSQLSSCRSTRRPAHIFKEWSRASSSYSTGSRSRSIPSIRLAPLSHSKGPSSRLDLSCRRIKLSQSLGLSKQSKLNRLILISCSRQIRSAFHRSSLSILTSSRPSSFISPVVLSHPTQLRTLSNFGFVLWKGCKAISERPRIYSFSWR
jgi:hypothetical protein